MATLLKVLDNLADIKSAGGVALGLGTQGGAYADKVLQEQAVRESGFDYTIVRPTRLTTAAGTGRYTARVGPGPVPSSIAQADVAHFILDALGTREYVGKTVSLGGPD
jgi:uncharacterized protein YbjT (DUF2867 family)